jgi:hypothetical protein
VNTATELKFTKLSMAEPKMTFWLLKPNCEFIVCKISC